MPASNTKAAAPNAVHTEAYPPMNADSTLARASVGAVPANSRIIGTLEGSIMAPSITCQATTEMARAVPKGRVLSIKASWCNSPDVPLNWAAIAAAQHTAMPTGTARGSLLAPRAVVSMVVISSRCS